MILRTFISECRNLPEVVRDFFMEIQNEQKTSQELKKRNPLNNQQVNFWKAKKYSPLTVVMIGIVVLISACTSSSSQPQAPPPTTVSVSSPLEEVVTQYDEFTGRFRAVERVEVRPRVDGYIEEIRFTDGEFVEKGDILFVVDQRPYRIALEQAQAELESAKTRLQLSEKELQRANNLLSTGAVSQELIDRRNQEYLSAKAAVSSSQATVQLAELNMEFTEIKAPVSGKISENYISVGNLVSGGLSSATLLTTIVSYDPIYFTFEASEAKLLKYQKENSLRGDRSSIGNGNRTVMAKLLGEKEFLHNGELDFIDNEIDQSTGTILVRAVFTNKDLLFTPGMFAKAKFSGAGQHREILIPDEAIGSDQANRYVLVVDDSSKVNRKFIKTGALHNNMRIVEEGLNKTDQVIIKGMGKVSPGQEVLINRDEIALAQEDTES